MVAQADQTICQCGEEMGLKSITFTDCYAEVAMTEAFNNGRKKHIPSKKFESLGKVSVLTTPGHYNTLNVTISSGVLAVRGVQQRKHRALILSVENNRAGALEEQEHAREFLTRCNFHVDLRRNPTRGQMVEALKSFSCLQDHQGQCAVAIMAHGSEDCIHASDTGVALSDLFGLLDAKNAPHLAQTPKYFFIQACRSDGKALTQDMEDSSDGFTRAQNFHWCFATTPGNVAKRGRMFESLNEASKVSPGHGLRSLCVSANAKMRDQDLLMVINHTLTKEI